jgi:glycosyltransferase involved in cell wall biosynthesis
MLSWISSDAKALNARDNADINMWTLLLVSSVEAKPTSGGEILLFRHLVNRANIHLIAPKVSWNGNSFDDCLRRLGGHAKKLGFITLADVLSLSRKGKWIDPKIKNITEFDAILTVAHGDAFMAAQRIAKRASKPLISIFHDWWPDLGVQNSILRKRIERDFRSLYRSSDLALCVCEGMRERLGNHDNSHVLFPIPDSRPHLNLTSNFHPLNSKLKLVYFGNLSDYGDMLRRLLAVKDLEERVNIEIRGNATTWPKQDVDFYAATGSLLPFAPRQQLEEWLSTADMYLVCMSFNSCLRVRMETSFPSKMVEYAQFGRPLVIWGPEYCSAIKWARSGNKAICVTEESPHALMRKVKEVGKSLERYRFFSNASFVASQTEFSATAIQSQFDRFVEQVICSFNRGGLESS